MARPDWITLRAEYIAGGISYRQLATKHGVNVSTLEKRAIREGWAADLQQACSKVAADLPGVVAEKVTRQLSEYLADSLLALDVALSASVNAIRAGGLEFKSLGEAVGALARAAKTQADIAAMAQGAAVEEGGAPERFVVVDPGPDLDGLDAGQLARLYREALNDGGANQ